MPIEPLVIVLIMVLGIAAFFFGIVVLFCRVLTGVGRSVANLFSPRRRLDRPPRRVLGSGSSVCPRPNCRKIETRRARFCSRCGCRLRRN